LAVPSDDGLGFHNAQRRAPAGPPLESPTQTSPSQIAIAGNGFGARAAAQGADDGVPGSPRAERPEFEGSGEWRRAGKRGVPTFPLHPTTPRRKFNAFNEHGFLGRDRIKVTDATTLGVLTRTVVAASRKEGPSAVEERQSADPSASHRRSDSPRGT
jgi:hypothetical protein